MVLAENLQSGGTFLKGTCFFVPIPADSAGCRKVEGRPESMVFMHLHFNGPVFSGCVLILLVIVVSNSDLRCTFTKYLVVLACSNAWEKSAAIPIMARRPNTRAHWSCDKEDYMDGASFSECKMPDPNRVHRQRHLVYPQLMPGVYVSYLARAALIVQRRSYACAHLCSIQLSVRASENDLLLFISWHGRRILCKWQVLRLRAQ